MIGATTSEINMFNTIKEKVLAFNDWMHTLSDSRQKYVLATVVAIVVGVVAYTLGYFEGLL